MNNYTFWNCLYQKAISNKTEEDIKKGITELKNLNNVKGYFEKLAKAVGENKSTVINYYHDLLCRFEWMKGVLARNFNESSYDAKFKNESYIFSEEVYCVCDMLSACQLIDNLEDIDYVEIYKSAHYDVVRCKWILYLCNLIGVKIEDKISEKQKDTEIYTLYNTFKIERDIFKGMFLSDYEMKSIYFNRVKEQCNYFLTSSQNKNKAFFLFFKKYMPDPQIFLGKSESVKYIQCYFMYFYIKQLKPNMFAEKDARIAVFKSIFEKAGLEHNLVKMPYIENVITRIALNNNDSCEKWFEELKNWESVRGKYAPYLSTQLETIFEGPINYSQWYQALIIPGLEEENKVLETRKSLNMIKNSIDKWDKNERVRDEIIRNILDTELRRRWYFYRIIGDIIEKQQKSFIKGSDNDKIPPQISEIWVRENGELVIDKIVNTFNYAFDVNAKKSKGMALATCKHRKMGNDRVDKVYKNQKRPMRVEIDTLLRQTDKLTGKTRRVSRQLLLMSILLGKVYGVERFNMERVKVHVLYNSRFGTTINEDNDFDSYFLKTFNELSDESSIGRRVEILQRNSGLFEAKYVENNVAIFREYVLGKE